MNPPLRFLLVPLFSGFASSWLSAQTALPVEVSANGISFETLSRRVVPLKDGSGRKLILEQVKPPVLPPPPAVVPPVPVDPAVREARRLLWAAEAKKERRMLSLTGITYPNGQTFLQWFTPGADGQWRIYEAWTLTDLRACPLVHEFEVGETIYHVFANVFPASRFDTRRAMPGPLYFPEGSPGFRLIKGDPLDVRGTAPVAALHQIFKNEGPQLTGQWLAMKAVQEEAAAWLKANPPPVQDIRVRFWLGENVKMIQATPQPNVPSIPR